MPLEPNSSRNATVNNPTNPSIVNNPTDQNSNYQRPHTTVQTTTREIQSPSIHIDTKNILSKNIEEEIKKAIANPTPEIRIITPTIPKITIECPVPLTSVVSTISDTMDKISLTNNIELLREFMENISTFIDTIQSLHSRIEND